MLATACLTPGSQVAVGGDGWFHYRCKNESEGKTTLSSNLEQKKAAVAEIGAQVASAQAIVLAEYRSLPVGEMTALRKKAREAGVYFRVLKNTLARRAVADTPYQDLADKMSGPLAYGISADPVSAAKVLHEFAKANDKLVIKAGAMPGVMMSPQQVAALASMPSREELLAKLVGTMQAPVVKFVRTLNEVPSKFVRAMAAVHDQKASQSAASSAEPSAEQSVEQPA